MEDAILKIRELKVHFPLKGGFFRKTIGYTRAVDGVSLDIKKGETMGCVGESGCGKTTLGRATLLLVEPTSGEIYFEGRCITEARKHEIKGLRKDMQIVFQDPFGSLSPRMNVLTIVGRPMNIHGQASSRQETLSKVQELLTLVGLKPEHAYRYPHQFSGGQRQRIAIARALAVNPRFIVLDEPTSALDLSVQAQILNLLLDLKDDFELTYLFISHDLSVIKYLSDRVTVMYAGRIVEAAKTEQLFDSPLHPYTQGLFSAVPIPDPTWKRKHIRLRGEVPNPTSPPSGCRFHPRCPMVTDQCADEAPELCDVGNGHYVCCHLLKQRSVVTA
jgi:oligopeptide/dipeptide ABC transporter ATP-binding protein